MYELFYWGGPLFMSILTLQLIVVLFFIIRYITKKEKTDSDLQLIKSSGLLAAMTGILGQLIGLYQAFQAISEAGSVSPGIVAEGLGISMITTIYGLLIYIVSMIFWLFLRIKK